MATKKRKTPKAPLESDGPHVVSLRKLARALGVHQTTALSWNSLPDFPRNEDGTFPVGRVARWMEEREQKPPGRKREEARDELRDLKIARARLDLEILQGGLIRKEDQDARDEELIAVFRRWILVTFPRRLFPSEPAEQARARLVGNEMLEVISGIRRDFEE